VDFTNTTLLSVFYLYIVHVNIHVHARTHTHCVYYMSTTNQKLFAHKHM